MRVRRQRLGQQRRRLMLRLAERHQDRRVVDHRRHRVEQRAQRLERIIRQGVEKRVQHAGSLVVSAEYVGVRLTRSAGRAEARPATPRRWTRRSARGHPRHMADDAELVIAGAGLNGMLLGVACAGAGLSVAIVDPQDPEAMLDRGFDGRTSAIAYGSRLVFDALGLWPDIAADAEPIREIRIADDDSPLFLHYDCRELIATGHEPARCRSAISSRTASCAASLLDRARALPSLRLIGGAPRRRDARDRDRRRDRARRRHAAARPARRRRRRRRIRRCAVPPASARSNGATARSASSRPSRTSGRMPASRSSIFCPPARSRSCR